MKQHFGIVRVEWNLGVSVNHHISATHHQLAKTVDAVVNVFQTRYIRLYNRVRVAIDIVADVLQAVQLMANI